MKVWRKLKNIALWIMLISISAAYTGKALHTHSGSYYDALMDTRNEASNGMSDNCPICHFTLLFFLATHNLIIVSVVVLLSVISVADVICRTVEHRDSLALRAPPVLL